MRQIPLRTLVNKLGGIQVISKLNRNLAITALNRAKDEILAELSAKGIQRSIADFSEFIDKLFPDTYTFDPTTLKNPTDYALVLAGKAVKNSNLNMTTRFHTRVRKFNLRV